MPVEDFPEWDAVNKKIAKALSCELCDTPLAVGIPGFLICSSCMDQVRAGHKKWKEKLGLSSTDRNTCPHGHPCIFIKVDRGMMQAVGGKVLDGPFKGKDCPLCIEINWTGVPFREEPPPPPPATFVTNG